MIFTGKIDAIKRMREMMKPNLIISRNADSYGKFRDYVDFNVASLKECKDLTEDIMALGVAEYLKAFDEFRKPKF